LTAHGPQLTGLLHLDGYIASAATFTDQPFVLEGASELLLRVLGDRGVHTRSAVPVPILPLNACVELVLTFTVEGADA
ncbi:MAG: RidA family protein, partial [Phycicoccus sp.]